MDELLIDGPADAPWTLVLAHGAGAPMDTPFMNDVAAGLARRGLGCVRFEFPYMRARRETGKRGGPNRMPALLESFGAAIEAARTACPDSRLAAGGKSMGGRVASMLADATPAVEAVVCLGYPFHPPGKPEKLRTEHLLGQATPTLIVQGTRDPFGTPDEVAGYGLAPTIRVTWLEDGDHSFKPRKRSGETLEGHITAAVDAAATFLSSID
ncbi:MAG: alpha/beta family hydrolase [Pseudomonadota bacterium]